MMTEAYTYPNLGEAMFHLHEENENAGAFSPRKTNGITAAIGVMVSDVDSVFSRAIAAGAVVLDPAKDYDYGYRQGKMMDPDGHHWLIKPVI